MLAKVEQITFYSAATLEYHVIGSGNDTPPNHNTLLLCYPLEMSATMEATTAHYMVLGFASHSRDIPQTKHSSATMVAPSEKYGRHTVHSVFFYLGA